MRKSITRRYAAPAIKAEPLAAAHSSACTGRCRFRSECRHAARTGLGRAAHALAECRAAGSAVRGSARRNRYVRLGDALTHVGFHRGCATRCTIRSVGAGARAVQDCRCGRRQRRHGEIRRHETCPVDRRCGLPANLRGDAFLRRRSDQLVRDGSRRARHRRAEGDRIRIQSSRNGDSISGSVIPVRSRTTHLPVRHRQASSAVAAS